MPLRWIRNIRSLLTGSFPLQMLACLVCYSFVVSLYLPVLIFLSVVVAVVVKVFVSYVTHSHGECHGLEKVVKYVWARIG